MKASLSFTMLSLVVVGLFVATSRAEDKAEEKKAAQVRFYVNGAFCEGCATVLSEALVEGGVKNASKISPNKGVGYVIVLAQFDHSADLSRVAKVVNASATPHREQVKPGIALELFAKLDKKSAAGVQDTLAKVKGVDAKGSTVNAKRGVISVRLTGESELSVGELVSALEKSGVQASVVTAGKDRRILGEKVEKKVEKKK